MEKQLRIFNNEEFGEVRVVMIDGTPWFVGTDVAAALGYADTFGALKKHVDDEDKRVLNEGDFKQMASERKTVETTGLEFGSPRGLTFINESGLYSLILRSNLDSAKKFKRWVTSEILPTIRKTGSYSVDVKQLPPVSLALVDVKTAVEQIQSLFAVKRGIALSQALDIVGKKHDVELDGLKQLLPPAEHETGYLNATRIGEKLGGLSPQHVNQLLAKGGLQYKDGKDWRLTDAGKEYGEEIPYTRNGHSGYRILWNLSVVEKARSILAQDVQVG